MRRLFIALTIVSLFHSIAPAYSADRRAAWDYEGLPQLDSNQTKAVYGFEVGRSIQEDFSWTQATPTGTNFQSVLSPCSSYPKIDQNYTACITNVSYRKKGASAWEFATLSSFQLGEPNLTFNGKPMPKSIVVGKISANSNFFVPEGDKATIWTMKGADHSLGNDYLVRVRFLNESAQPITADGGYNLRLVTEIIPVKYPSQPNPIVQGSMQIGEFPNDYEYKIRIKTGVFIKAVTGWFFGRLVDPYIDRNGPLGYLEVGGSPASVPIGITNAFDAEEVKKYFDPQWCANNGFDWNRNCAPTVTTKAVPYTSSDVPTGALEILEKAPGGVTTAATISYWYFETSFFHTSAFYSPGPQQCANQLYGAGARVFQGAVFSNASLFQTSEPAWNAENQSLAFKVASPHLDEKGKPNIGFYTLYIPIEMANCIWGKGVSSPRAEVQIVSSDGKSSITTVATKVESGMLRFHVAGFGYSSPTIKIRMQNETIKTSENKEKATKTISCIKGKIFKKVSGSNPKCPAGYKIKN